MEYKFLNEEIDIDNIVLPSSEKINNFLQKNNYADIIKAIDFFNSDKKFLYIHGFLGTGKRQFINYVTEFLNNDVIKLEYYCKASTVCDDILLSFLDEIEKHTVNSININAKIMSLAVKFQQAIANTKKPFMVVLHSFDDIDKRNKELVIDCLEKVSRSSNIKIIASTRAMIQDVLGNVDVDTKIFLKGFSKEIFKEYLNSNKVIVSETTADDFYDYTRGYYYYIALSLKIIQAKQISLNEFLEQFALSGESFDSYLGKEYIALVPSAIRNFFWFLRTVRHGITLNALAVYELYDEFSIQYLIANLMAFQVDETIYVQDYFQQDISISIPVKTEIKLHKYIISIYEKELKEPLKTRTITMSRQAFRAEIDYHNNKISELESGKVAEGNNAEKTQESVTLEVQQTVSNETLQDKIQQAQRCEENNNSTGAIEIYNNILEKEVLNSNEVADIRKYLARIYTKIRDFHKAEHYYQLVEKYYVLGNEYINLNYLYYEMAKLYIQEYKNDRAIETIKKVIYSVDTPKSLMLESCVLLGNIYTEIKKDEEAKVYYEKGIETIDENSTPEVLSELYFKYALVSDEQNNQNMAFEYYTKCINCVGENQYTSLAYSNLGSCYYENGNISDAMDCFQRAYDIEKSKNNYDGIYYTSSHLAKIYTEEHIKQAIDFLTEAKQSAEFINDEYCIMESSVNLGDYYYNDKNADKKALNEYFYALKSANKIGLADDINKIKGRIEDMRLRMEPEDFNEIEKKYGKY